MKLKNTSEDHIAFDIDGVQYKAAPHGPVTPDVPVHKAPNVLKIHRLPVAEHKPEPEKAAAAPVEPPKVEPKPEPEKIQAPQPQGQGRR